LACFFGALVSYAVVKGRSIDLKQFNFRIEEEKKKRINALLMDALFRVTCSKRKVGAVLELKNGIFVQGWNGPPKGMEEYCTVCPRGEVRSGEAMDLCPAVHGEMRALLRALGNDTRGSTLYLTCGLPCKDCMTELAECGISKIVSPYPLTLYPACGYHNFPLADKIRLASGIEYIYDEEIVKDSTSH